MTLHVREIVGSALREDLGTGDITSDSVIPESACVRAKMIVKSPGIIAGLPVVHEVFRQVDPSVVVQDELNDGARVMPGEILCHIEGPARSVLSGERVALNFIQRLSGIATKTATFVDLVKGTHARIADTRKTTPGLRVLEKYAVRAGGGFNHRMGLYDAVMIKDNHIVAAGGIREAIRLAHERIPHTMTVTVECSSLEQVVEAVSAEAEVLLLDNMDISTLNEAVKLISRRAITEASGGVSEGTVTEIASTGVDIISVGALTHSSPSLDISLDFLVVTSPKS